MQVFFIKIHHFVECAYSVILLKSFFVGFIYQNLPRDDAMTALIVCIRFSASSKTID